MARGASGKIVSWTDKDGNKKSGIAYDKDPVFNNIKKVLVHYLNEDLVTKEKDPQSGKNLVGLVAMDKLTVIGFVD